MDLKQEGLIDKLPRCILVQAMGSNAIVRSWEKSKEIILEKTDSIADSISVESPANAEMAVDYLYQSNGWGVSISDKAILQAQKKLATNTGIFVEPSAAAAWAGLEADLERKIINPDMNIVVLATGTGFGCKSTKTIFNCIILNKFLKECYMMQAYNKISDNIIQGLIDQKLIRLDSFTYDIRSHTFFDEGREIEEAEIKKFLDHQIKETCQSQQIK